MRNDGNSDRHYLEEVPKISAYGGFSHKSKRGLFLGRKTMTNLESVLKTRDITPPYSQSYCFPRSYVQMWELYHKDGWALNNWCFWALMNPLDCTEIKPVNLKENQSWIFIGRTDTEAEAQMFGQLIWRANSLEKSLILKIIEGRIRRG